MAAAWLMQLGAPVSGFASHAPGRHPSVRSGTDIGFLLRSPDRTSTTSRQLGAPHRVLLQCVVSCA